MLRRRTALRVSRKLVQALATQFGVSDLVFALRLSKLGLTNPEAPFQSGVGSRFVSPVDGGKFTMPFRNRLFRFSAI